MVKRASSTPSQGVVYSDLLFFFLLFFVAVTKSAPILNPISSSLFRVTPCPPDLRSTLFFVQQKVEFPIELTRIQSCDPPQSVQERKDILFKREVDFDEEVVLVRRGLGAKLRAFFHKAKEKVKEIGSKIKKGFEKVKKVVCTVVKKAAKVMSRVVSAVAGAASFVTKGIPVLSGALKGVSKAAGKVSDSIKVHVSKAWDKVDKGLKIAADPLGAAVNAIKNKVKQKAAEKATKAAEIVANHVAQKKNQ